MSQSSSMATAQARAERWHRNVIAIPTNVDDAVMATAATETPRGERLHAIRAHVAEGHEGCIGFINKNPADQAGLFISK